MTDDPVLDLQRVREKARAAQSAMASVTGRGVSANGEVTAVVDANGRLRDLQLRPGALRLGSRLAAYVLEATAAAEADAAQKAQQVARPLTEDPILVSAQKIVREFFGEPARDAPHTTRPMSEQEMDDYYANYDPLRGRR